MRFPTSSPLLTLALFVLTPIAANALCQPAELSSEQDQYLRDNGIDPAEILPDGEFADYTTMRCDVDDNSAVDIIDIRAISAKRNQLSTGPDDPMDFNEDGMITVADARGCQRACTMRRCAIQPVVNVEGEEPVITGSHDGEDCSQNEDFDGDGIEDFAGLVENTSEEERNSDWELDLLLLYTEDGATKHVTFPSAGRYSAEDGEIYDTLVVQPIGVVNLFPGSITLTRPGVVSYRNGRPAVLYFWQDGRYTQRVFYVDD